MHRSTRRPASRLLALSIAALFAATPAWPCTSILVSRGASADGSTMITYAADSHTLYGELYLTPAGLHAAGAMRDIVEWDTGKLLGRIPQAPVTYQTLGNMNEHQVVITETTWGGRKELAEPSGILDYGSLIWIALERAKTAREAILVMGKLLDEHGYASSGETFSISDPNEVWLMEMIGKGKGRKGAVWVARRVPDGALSAHANQARIRHVPAGRPRDHPLLEGRDRVRARDGVVRRAGRGVQLRRHLRPARLRRAAASARRGCGASSGAPPPRGTCR